MKKLVFVILAFGLWIMFTWSFTIANLAIGFGVAILTVLLFGKYFIGDVRKLFDPGRYFWFVVYLFIFTWECIKANFDVAYRVLHPDLPIKPGIVKIKTSLKSSLGRTTLANSITMTPGTITVDIIDDAIYVHWIYVSTMDPSSYSEKIAGKFEKYIRKIFE